MISPTPLLLNIIYTSLDYKPLTPSGVRNRAIVQFGSMSHIIPDTDDEIRAVLEVLVTQERANRVLPDLYNKRSVLTRTREENKREIGYRSNSAPVKILPSAKRSSYVEFCCPQSLE
jgi:hypothetical protein